MTVDGAVEFLVALEAKLSPGAACFAVDSALRNALKEVAADDARLQALRLALMVLDYRLHPPPFPKGVEPPLAPMFESYPPPVKDLKAEPAGLLEGWLDRTLLPSVKARVGEVLWALKRDPRYAAAAIDGYIAFVDAARGRDLVETPPAIARAVGLVRKTKTARPELVPLFEKVSVALLDAGNGVARKFLSAGAQILDGEVEAGRRIAAAAERAANASAKEGGQARIAERSFLAAADVVAEAAGDTGARRSLCERIARSHEAEATERAAEGGGVQSVLLQRALEGFAELGLRDDVERVKKSLQAATTASMKDLKAYGATTEIPRAEIEAEVARLLESVADEEGPAHIGLFARDPALWPAWSDVKARAEAIRKEFPLQHLLPVVMLTEDGRQIPPIEDEAQRLFMDEAQSHKRDLQILLSLVFVKIDMLRARGKWSEDVLLAHLARGALFDDIALSAIAPGIEAFEEGRMWEALHTLVPQVERVVRRLAEGVGTQTSRFVPKTGELHWSSLKVLLENDEVKKVLNRVGEDFDVHMRLCLIDSRHLNIRDDVAHGIRHPTSRAELEALIVLLFLLALGDIRVAGPEIAAAR